MSHPPQQVAEVRAVLQPLEAQQFYASTARNSIRSRAWAAAVPGCSYKVDKAWVVTRSGTTYDLQGHQNGPPVAAATFAPIQLERMITRSSAGPGARQRLLQEVTAMFNLVNEPWLKYNLTAVADRGLKPHEWTSARLHNHVLYLESHKQRYELSRVPLPEGSEEGVSPDKYRFCVCKRPLLAAAMRAMGVPLPEDEKALLHDDLAWEAIKVLIPDT